MKIKINTKPIHETFRRPQFSDIFEELALRYIKFPCWDVLGIPLFRTIYMLRWVIV